MNNSFTTNTWDRLLKRIAEKNVIPVIGNEMYKYIDSDKLVGIEDYLLNQLLDQFDTDEPGLTTLAQAVNYLVIEQRRNISDIIDTLKDLVSKQKFEFPLINHLLTINQFYFYTNSTVYTNILDSRIEEVRQEKPRSIDYSIDDRFDDCDVDKLSKPCVFNVFGSLFHTLDPALGEEEMLEFTASFQERMATNAQTVLYALKNKTLLFLGCSQPEWMTRFFLRVLSNQRMNDWPRRRSNIIVVNDESDERQKQFEFLNNYNAVTYPGSTADFVKELADRWEKFPDKGKPKMVFISYTQKDLAAVEIFKDALSKIENLSYWYDKEKLFSGDNYEYEITENIKNADVFIPLISENSVGQPDKYVLKEWERAHAFNIVKGVDKNDKYLMPIIIDNTDLNNATIKYYYGNVSIEPLPGGTASEGFINRLKKNLNLL
jgi:hypothetical protein